MAPGREIAAYFSERKVRGEIVLLIPPSPQENARR